MNLNRQLISEQNDITILTPKNLEIIINRIKKNEYISKNIKKDEQHTLF